ncbi:hypothetical protein [Herbaspirillum sp. RV1423]|uniref:hypothetical protein n=1 Tax=Herbaspirillum sp. RV1423 TaxID=1443993 RepID=UPI00055808AF|nr:hypothetical protein [Herbaspirillum sp. RV1423]
MATVEKIASVIGLRQSNEEGIRRFHSAATVGVTLNDFVAFERELRREIANSISPAPNYQPTPLAPLELAQRDVERLEALVKSLARKASPASAEAVLTLEERTNELNAAKERLAEMLPAVA